MSHSLLPRVGASKDCGEKDPLSLCFLQTDSEIGVDQWSQSRGSTLVQDCAKLQVESCVGEHELLVHLQTETKESAGPKLESING